MSKWIKVKDGHWKTVPDDYDAPENEPPSKEGVPHLINKPPWAVYEDPVHNTNGEDNFKATDAFYEERKKWTSASNKWARYERSRKATLAKDKPAFLKAQKAKKGGD